MRKEFLQGGNSNLLLYDRRTNSFGSQPEMREYDMPENFPCELVQNDVLIQVACSVLPVHGGFCRTVRGEHHDGSILLQYFTDKNLFNCNDISAVHFYY